MYAPASIHEDLVEICSASGGENYSISNVYSLHVFSFSSFFFIKLLELKGLYVTREEICEIRCTKKNMQIT